jgi:hypothetical protein
VKAFLNGELEEEIYMAGARVQRRGATDSLPHQKDAARVEAGAYGVAHTPQGGARGS